MASVPTVNREGTPIRSVAEWEQLASPGKDRWAGGYSAKTLADLWIERDAQESLRTLFARQGKGAFDGIRLERAVAEAQTRFDEFGGPRNHDLLVTGSGPAGEISIGIEAKVNETFGETLAQYRDAADRKRDRDEPTNAPQRLRDLVSALTGSTLEERPELLTLRYQLFSAVAGTIAAAVDEQASCAAFVVCDLETTKSDPAAREANTGDLAAFARVVFRLEVPATDEWLLGPVRVSQATTRISDAIDLWLGHLRIVA